MTNLKMSKEDKQLNTNNAVCRTAPATPGIFVLSDTLGDQCKICYGKFMGRYMAHPHFPFPVLSSSLMVGC